MAQTLTPRAYQGEVVKAGQQANGVDANTEKEDSPAQTRQPVTHAMQSFRLPLCCHNLSHRHQCLQCRHLVVRGSALNQTLARVVRDACCAMLLLFIWASAFRQSEAHRHPEQLHYFPFAC